MIVRRNFRPTRILPYVRRELALATAASLATWGLVEGAGLTAIVLPFPPVAVVGTGLAIFLGFRSNQAWSRWWEARTLWGTLVNTSRILARLVIVGAEDAIAQGKGGGPEAVDRFRRQVVRRQIAFAHALRLHLRREDDWAPVVALLEADEATRVRAAANPPNLLVQLQASQLKAGVRDGILGPFDPIATEPALSALSNVQGGCERIKNTPMPRQVEFFTRVFLVAFTVLLAPATVGLFPPGARWVAVPLTIAVALVYALVNKVAEVTEEPFEARIQDVPMSALCTTIARDLLEQLGETEFPPKAEAVDGTLW